MIDTHLHLFDSAAHPFAADAPYRPQPNECSSLDALLALLDAHGVDRAVLVAPTSGYNHDLTPLVGTLQRAEGRLAGVARLSGDESTSMLDALAAAGVVGVRLDVRHDGPEHALHLERVVAEWARRRWFVQVQADAADWARLAAPLRNWPIDLLIDHCGLPDVASGLDQPGFAAVLGLGRRPGTWVKLSGAFRFSTTPWPHADADIFVHALLAAFGPSHCVWGSDWPFVRMTQRLDYGGVLGLLERWVSDSQVRAHILDSSARALLDR